MGIKDKMDMNLLNDFYHEEAKLNDIFYEDINIINIEEILKLHKNIFKC